MKIPYFKKGSLITIKVVENLYKGSKKKEPQLQQKKLEQGKTTTTSKERNIIDKKSDKSQILREKIEKKEKIPSSPSLPFGDLEHSDGFRHLRGVASPGKGLELELEFGPEKKITGICIKKKNKGRDSYVELKYVINNESIRQKFPLYSPFVIVSQPPEESKQRF